MTDNSPPRGLLIALEGGEGTGKTTQAERLTRHLNEAGKRTIMVREPGGTPLGNHLRSYLKGKGPIGLRAETLLFIAARAQSVEQTLKPSLQAGINVVTDRYLASTVAYQGHGRRGHIPFIHQLNHYATEGITPDLTLLLDLPPETGLGRAGKPQLEMSLEPSDTEGTERTDEHNERRFEDQPLAFHKRARAGYKAMAASDPTWVTIDAANHPDSVEQSIWLAITSKLILHNQ